VSYSLTAKRLRLPLGFLLSAVYLAFARPTAASLTTGGAIAAAGLLVRAWASGHIAKNERLATRGPYAHTRNPLYFGSFLIAAGFAVAAHWSLLLIVVAFFVFVYGPTMGRERENISRRFPEAYATYSANVPAFFPRITPWSGARESDEGFSFALYMKHGEWKAALGFALAMAWLVIRIAMQN
jgi:protein-S-isoprenylcysteine O-methyltransferase Ste14